MGLQLEQNKLLAGNSRKMTDAKSLTKQLAANMDAIFGAREDA